MSTFGRRVRELRQAKGLTQQALAGDGISAGYVSLIESGKRMPSSEIAHRIAERLGVPVDLLLDVERSRSTEQARVEINFARMALANGNPGEAVRCLAGLSLEGLDTRTASDGALVLAESLQQTGQLDEAVATLESLVERCRRDGAGVALAIAAATLTAMYVESGDIERAVTTGEGTLKEVEAAGLEGTDEHIRLGATFVWACYERGDLLYATHRVEELIRTADRAGSTRARGSIYWNASLVAHGRGRIDDALRLSERALALLGEQVEDRDLPRLRGQYAWLLLHKDVPAAEQALEELDRLEADPALRGSRLDLGSAAALRGQAHLMLGNLDDAAEHAAIALQRLGPSNHINRAMALILLGDVGAARFEDDLAQEAYREARHVLSNMKESRAVARLWRELGDSLRDVGDIQGSVEAYDHSLRIMGLSRRPFSRVSQLVKH